MARRDNHVDLVQGDFVEAFEYNLVRQDNPTVFIETRPSRNHDIATEGAGPTSKPQLGVHYMCQSHFQAKLRWSRPASYALLSGYPSYEAAKAVVEGFRTGKWVISTIRGGLFAQARMSTYHDCTVFLNILPASTTKEDILSSIPLTEQRPARISIVMDDTDPHEVEKICATILSMCRQVGNATKFTTHALRPMPERTIARNYHAIAHFPGNSAQRASQLLDMMLLPSRSNRSSHLIYKACQTAHFRIISALLNLAMEKLVVSSKPWGDKGVTFRINRKFEKK